MTLCSFKEVISFQGKPKTKLCQTLYPTSKATTFPLSSCCVLVWGFFSGGKGPGVRPYLTHGIEAGIRGLSSLNLTPLLITCWISLLAPHRVLS